MSCRSDYIRGVPSVILGFDSVEQMNGYIRPMADRVALPFCEAANRANRQASLYITLAEKRARRFDCEMSTWGDWFDLDPQPTKPAQQPQTLADTVASCERLQKAADVPVSCSTDYVQGVLSMFVGFRNISETRTYLDQVDKVIGTPFCTAANSANRQASFYLIVGRKDVRRYSCELHRWEDWVELPDPQPAQPRPANRESTYREF